MKECESKHVRREGGGVSVTVWEGRVVRGRWRERGRG